MRNFTIFKFEIKKQTNITPGKLQPDQISN